MCTVLNAIVFNIIMCIANACTIPTICASWDNAIEYCLRCGIIAVTAALNKLLAACSKVVYRK